MRRRNTGVRILPVLFLHIPSVRPSHTLGIVGTVPALPRTHPSPAFAVSLEHHLSYICALDPLPQVWFGHTDLNLTPWSRLSLEGGGASFCECLGESCTFLSAQGDGLHKGGLHRTH